MGYLLGDAANPEICRVEGPYGSTKQDALSYASLILNGDCRRRPWILIAISEAKRKRITYSISVAFF